MKVNTKTIKTEIYFCGKCNTKHKKYNLADKCCQEQCNHILAAYHDEYGDGEIYCTKCNKKIAKFNINCEEIVELYERDENNDIVNLEDLA